MGKFKRSERPSGKDRSERKPRFNRRDSSNKFSRDSRPRRDKLEMHSVTCDKCRKKCEVPFLPSGNKPVYCSDCFRKSDESKNTLGSELEKINDKLDRIIRALEL